MRLILQRQSSVLSEAEGNFRPRPSGAHEFGGAAGAPLVNTATNPVTLYFLYNGCAVRLYGSRQCFEAAIKESRLQLVFRGQKPVFPLNVSTTSS